MEGYDALHLDNGLIALTMLPTLGGKISSLRDVRSGREWLWRHPRLAYQNTVREGAYTVIADTGGWDECFPTVGPCHYPSEPWKGAELQDHGEMWSQEPVLTLTQEEKGAALETRWQGIALPYTFARTIRMEADSNCMRFEYAVTNHADASLQFVWSAHPLMAIEPGMQLRVPADAGFYRWAPDGSGGGKLEAGSRFPLIVEGFDLSALPPTSAGISFKLWSEPLREGWATLAANNGEFRLRWDAALLPQLAVYMNFGAWAADGGTPYYNMGLELCMGMPDSLEEAVTRYDVFETLASHQMRSWWLKVEMGNERWHYTLTLRPSARW